MRYFFRLLTVIFLFHALPALARDEPDSTQAFVRTWNLEKDFIVQHDAEIDTFQQQLQLYNPVFRSSISNAYPGNVGMPAKDLIIPPEQNREEFLFLRNYRPYLQLPFNTVYYNVRKPFTQLSYQGAGLSKAKREESAEVIHTQNASPFLNFGGQFRLFSSEGQYANQKSKVSLLDLFGSYSRDRLSVHASFNYNKFQNQENGGLLNDSLFRNSDDDPKTYETNLAQGKSDTRKLVFFVSGQYVLNTGREGSENDSLSPPDRNAFFKKWPDRKAELAYSFRYSRNSRLYRDDFSGSDHDFYSNYYFDSTVTHDSALYHLVENRFQFSFLSRGDDPSASGIRLMMAHQYERYGFHVPSLPLTDNYYHNLFFRGSLSGKYKAGWKWDVQGTWHATGYKQGDYSLVFESGRYKDSQYPGSIIKVKAGVRSDEPDYFLQKYSSNHFMWHHDFPKTGRMDLGLYLDAPARRLRADIRFSSVRNFVYFGSGKVPELYAGALNMISVRIHKHFITGPFHSMNKVVLQHVDEKSALDVPFFNVYSSDYFEFWLVSDVLRIQAGIDFFYQSRYSGYGYVPSTGRFYLGNGDQAGNYVYIDPFITARLKRTRLFVKYEHVNSGLWSKDYFMVRDYPMPPRAIKFGLSWTFYD